MYLIYNYAEDRLSGSLVIVISQKGYAGSWAAGDRRVTVGWCACMASLSDARKKLEFSAQGAVHFHMSRAEGGNDKSRP